MSSTASWNEEKPLEKVTCTSSDCEQDLHSFLRKYPRGQSYRNGKCRDCGVDLIDWHRLDRHDLSDVEHTIGCLELELIRHTYWHETFDQTAINHAKRKGCEGLRIAAERRLNQSVGAPKSELPRDGYQTPFTGNVLYYAQHSTATCCRKCIEAWHGIDREQALTNDQIGYMTQLLMHYVDKRMPELTPTGEKVARRRRGQQAVA